MRPPDQNEPAPPLALWIVLIIVTCSSLLLGIGIWSVFEMFMTEQEETALVQSVSE